MKWYTRTHVFKSCYIKAILSYKKILIVMVYNFDILNLTIRSMSNLLNISLTFLKLGLYATSGVIDSISNLYCLIYGSIIHGFK